MEPEPIQKDKVQSKELYNEKDEEKHSDEEDSWFADEDSELSE